MCSHCDVIKWKHFPRYWAICAGNSPVTVNSPHKGQWRGVLMCSLICNWTNGWVNNREAGDLRRHRAHYDVILMDGLVGNSLRPKQNGCNLRMIFRAMNVCMLFIKILVCCRGLNWHKANIVLAPTGDRPLSEPTWTSSLTHICVTRPQLANNCISTTLALHIA